MYELSVLIPARNEIWLHRTIEDVLANSRGDTEVIVVLDGYESKEFPGMTWPEPGIPVHERVTVIHHPVSTGQRASTNEAARVSTAPYIMKLDAHCALDEGFDVKLLEAAEELGDEVCQIPGQYNLHVFDWVCAGGPEAEGCGFREYQGPSSRFTKAGDGLQCPECGGQIKKDILWKRRKSRYATAWRFDQALHFQYWGKFKERQSGDLVETMSCLGACWFVSRQRFWELDGLDEGHGSWGQMGTELACKHWLSGGRLVCNKRTWFAHLFRTRGGDFGFPYPLSKNATDKARAYSRDLWLNNKWPKAKRPFDWIVNYFAPVPDLEVGVDCDLYRVLNRKTLTTKLMVRVRPLGRPRGLSTTPTVEETRQSSRRRRDSSSVLSTVTPSLR
jgi:glycosyltransferase involved in cell wall biosynthesis